MMRRMLLGTVVSLLPLGRAEAAVPASATYTGYLTEAGAPVTGERDLTFRLFLADEGGDAVFEELHEEVAVADGRFQVTLGEGAGGDVLDATLFGGEVLWLELAVGGTALAPRTAVRSVPYALRAGEADSAATADFADAAGDADTLGGQAPSAFAAAGHAHAGTYLPLGESLACADEQKVVGFAASGDVICAAAFDGSGAATLAARSDHAHAGAYLPLGATLACASGVVTGFDAVGNVACAADTPGVAPGSDGTFLRAQDGAWASSPILAADLPADSDAYIRNQTDAAQAANFRIDGTATAHAGVYTGNEGTHMGNAFIELGADDTTAASPGATPFIDFHYGTGAPQDFNVRLINDGNGWLHLQGMLSLSAPLGLSYGGTGASDAASARVNLGVEYTPANGLSGTAGSWTNVARPDHRHMITKRSNTACAGNTDNCSVYCVGDEIVVGGGCSNGNSIALQQSAPKSGAAAWSCNLLSNPGASWDAYVICYDPTPW